MLTTLLLNNQQACPPPFQRETVGLRRSNRAISDHTGAGGIVFGHWRRASVMLAPDNTPAPSRPEGSGTFRMATWNIIDGRGRRLMQAAAGLAQMEVGLGVLTEMKLVDDRHPKTASGYSIMCSKAVSEHQGGVALMWKENNQNLRSNRCYSTTARIL